LPTNCQAQDISKSRFTLLRAISRNVAQAPTHLKGGQKTGCGVTAHGALGFGRKGGQNRRNRGTGTGHPLWNGLPMTADIGSVP
jgi:hypothetical protein